MRDIAEIAKEYQAAVAARCARVCSPPGDVVECGWPDCNCDPLAQNVLMTLEDHVSECGVCTICQTTRPAEQE